MSADGFIKSLLRQKHEEFLKQLNLRDISDKIDAEWWQILRFDASDISAETDYRAEQQDSCPQPAYWTKTVRQKFFFKKNFISLFSQSF